MQNTVTHGMRLTINIGDLLKLLPEEVVRKCHILPLQSTYRVPICDIVSNEPFELFGEESWKSAKGCELSWVDLRIDTGNDGRTDPR